VLIYAVCLVFGGIGMREMAKKAGLKHSFLAFLPFANTYYAGKIAGESSFFGQKMKRGGLYAMLAEIACFALNVFLLVRLLLIDRYYVANPPGDVYSGQYVGYPERYEWLVRGEWTFQMIMMLLSLVQVIFFCVVYTAVFRKYYARNPFLMTVLCAIFPFRGFVLFAVRNNTPVDYNAYMRRYAEEYARRQGVPRGDAGGSGTESPFSEFRSDDRQCGEDPFAEFSEPSDQNHDDEKRE
ncbi:MAG: hypothetical protein ACI4NG_01950, partial [Candidatus Gallimonas sp.]